MAVPLNQLAPQNYGPQAMALPGGGQNLTTPRFTAQQAPIMQNLLQLGAQYFNPAAQEDLARKKFTTETIPGLAERFTAMGGGQRSSAFQGALGQAASDLESNLAAQRMNFGREALGIGLQPQFESHLQPEAPTAASAFFPQLLQGLGASAPQLAEVAGKYFLGGKGGAAPQTEAQKMQQAEQATIAAQGQMPEGSSNLSNALQGLGSAAMAIAPATGPAAPFIAGAGGIATIVSYLLGK